MKEDKYDFIMKWNGATGGGGGGQQQTVVKEKGSVVFYKNYIIPDWQIERIAEAVVRKLKEKEDPRYCDRNICTENEYNGISCDTCYIAQNYNLEDDDSPCLNCGVEW